MTASVLAIIVIVIVDVAYLNSKNRGVDLVKKFIKYLFENTKAYSFYRLLKEESYCNNAQFEKTPWGFEFIGSKKMQFGSFEFDETKLIQNILGKSEIFVDVGANTGYYTCLASKMHNKVISIEPLISNLRLLYLNLQKNGWTTNVEIFPLGVSEKYGIAEIYGCYTGASLIAGWADGSKFHKRTIPLSSLDIILGQRFSGKKMLIKIDVEGTEFDVLKGAKKILQMKPSPIWVVEITLTEHHVTGKNPYFLDTFRLFWQAGYEVREIGKEEHVISEEEIIEYACTGKQPNWKTTNYLFTPKAHSSEKYF
ncbi:MAG: FkbM family methyltransferase [Candidatus Lokiarchaeota archaeon]|nr:FkbM family methyltransferase [Candidatus Lokiarchaeota archaeon]